jgi:hypothetical protein
MEGEIIIYNSAPNVTCELIHKFAPKEYSKMIAQKENISLIAKFSPNFDEEQHVLLYTGPFLEKKIVFYNWMTKQVNIHTILLMTIIDN